LFLEVPAPEDKHYTHSFLAKREGAFTSKKIKGLNPVFDEDPFSLYVIAHMQLPHFLSHPTAAHSLFSPQFVCGPNKRLVVELWEVGVLNNGTFLSVLHKTDSILSLYLSRYTTLTSCL